MTRRRIGLSAVLAVAGLAGLLLLFARPNLSAPLFAAQRIVVASADWQSPSGRIAIDEEGVRAEAADASGTAVLLHEPVRLEGARPRFLHYAADGLASDARLVVFWQDGDARFRRLLPLVANRGVIDLASMDGWRGDLTSLAVVALPIDYLAPQAVPAQSFVLRALELRTDNWWSAMGVLVTDWLAPRPWTGRSINTAGREFDAEGPSLPAFVACAVVWVLGVMWLVLGSALLRRRAASVVAAGIALLVLDLVRDQFGRTAVVRGASARVEERVDLPLAADPVLAAEVAQWSDTLPGGSRERVLVHSAQPFPRDYAVYLLRLRADVAALVDSRTFDTEPVLDGMLFVVIDDGASFARDTGTLTVHGRSRAAVPVWSGTRLQVFRLGASAAPVVSAGAP